MTDHSPAHDRAPVGAIDCGTNSIKLLIGTPPDVVLRDSRVVRLGQGVDTTGLLGEEALARTFAAIDEFAAVLRAHGVPPDRTRFCATSATRDARNAAVFVDGVRARLGVTPDVLSGAEEAALVYAGAVGSLDPVPDEPVLVIDIGGGSTELVLGQDGPRESTSMDMGSVRLHERHLHADPPTADQVAACVADVAQHLDASRHRDRERAHGDRHVGDDQDDRLRRAGPVGVRPRRLRRRRPAGRRHARVLRPAGGDERRPSAGRCPTCTRAGPTSSAPAR